MSRGYFAKVEREKTTQFLLFRGKPTPFSAPDTYFVFPQQLLVLQPEEETKLLSVAKQRF